MKDVIVKCTVSPSKEKGRPLGRFECECGFIYLRKGPDINGEDRYKIGSKKQFGTVWEEHLRKMIVDNKLSVRMISTILQCSEETVASYAEKLGIRKLNDSSIKINKTTKKITPYNKELEEPYKQTVLKLIELEPNITRTQIRERLTKQYLWLYKHNKEWMKMTLPESNFKANCNQKGSLIVDWKKRDDDLSEKIVSAIQEIINEDTPKKVSLSLISKKVNYSPLYENLHKLPRSRSLIEKYCETTEDFQIRRLYIALEKLNIEESKITKSKLIQYAGLKRRTVKTNELLEKIVEDDKKK